MIGQTYGGKTIEVNSVPKLIEDNVDVAESACKIKKTGGK